MHSSPLRRVFFLFAVLALIASCNRGGGKATASKPETKAAPVRHSIAASAPTGSRATVIYNGVTYFGENETNRARNLSAR